MYSFENVYIPLNTVMTQAFGGILSSTSYPYSYYILLITSKTALGQFSVL